MCSLANLGNQPTAEPRVVDLLESDRNPRYPPDHLPEEYLNLASSPYFPHEIDNKRLPLWKST